MGSQGARRVARNPAFKGVSTLLSTRRKRLRVALAVGLAIFAAHQIHRHGTKYVFPMRFAEVVPGEIYRGAWQKDWPMRRIARDYKLKTVLALAHPYDSAIATKERELSQELGINWVHIPIVDQRDKENPKTLNELLDDAAAVINDPQNHPIYFHCHHGMNRVLMAQMAYRLKYCGWTLEQATEEVSERGELVKVSKGPDYRRMVSYYNDHILPERRAQQEAEAKAKEALAAEKPEVVTR